MTVISTSPPFTNFAFYERVPLALLSPTRSNHHAAFGVFGFFGGSGFLSGQGVRER
jgi:hypothetical protein